VAFGSSQQPLNLLFGVKIRTGSPQSVVDPPRGGTCCPLCGKAGIRLVAFTDAADVLHMIGAGPMPCDSS